MYAVVVEFRIKPQFQADFRREILINAAESLAKEPGCKVFDVCESLSGLEFFLYELYDDAAAFQRHLEMNHFTQFNATTADWVDEKTVRQYERLGVGALSLAKAHDDRPSINMYSMP